MYMISDGPRRLPTLTLLILIAAITAAVAVAAAATWLFIPKRPRINVRLFGIPTTAVAWGEPIKPAVEVEMPPFTSKVQFLQDKDPKQ